MKNLNFLLVLIWILAGFSFAQNPKSSKPIMIPKDSVLTIELEEITISSVRGENDDSLFSPESKSFYFQDPEKELSLNPGVTSVSFLISEHNVDNLPSQFTGMYFGEDMLLPILGAKIIFQGGSSIVNPDLFGLNLEADSYSASYGNVGGVKKMIPKKFKEGLATKISSDFVDRFVSLSGKDALFGAEIKSRVSLRQVKVFSLISKAIPELKLLPEVIDLESYIHLSKGKTSFEGYYLNSNQFQNFEEEGLEVTGINQNLNHNLLIGIVRHNLGESLLKGGFSYEEESQNLDFILNAGKKKSEEDLKSASFNLELSEKSEEYRGGFAFYSLKNKRLRGDIGRDIYQIYYEKRFILNNFLLNASVSFSNFNNFFGDSESFQALLFHKGSEFSFSIGKYETFLFDNGVLFGKSKYPKNSRKPDIGRHISLGGKIKNPIEGIEFLDVSIFLKFLNVEYLNEGYVEGSSKGLRFLAKSNLLNSLLTLYLANSKINNHGVSGTINYDFVLTFSIPFLNYFSLNSQVGLRDGIWSKNQDSGIYSRFDNSYFLNLSLSARFKIFGASFEGNVTGFNILGKAPELIQYFDSNGNLVSKKAPVWGNLRLSVHF